MNFKFKSVVSVFVFALSMQIYTHANAQKSAIYTDDDADFKLGVSLFQKQNFGSAQHLFDKTIATHDFNSQIRIDAEYYAAICGIELFNKDGELRLRNFITNHPESPKVKKAYFYLGKYNYRKKKYKDAIVWFDKVDVYDLNKDESPEYYFKKGYSYFKLEKLDSAKFSFYEIKDLDTKYSVPANYYYSHISYDQKNYEIALQGFLRLSHDASFGKIVPYYIVQIYYLEAKYDSVILYGKPMLDSGNTARAPEIARIIGESYYRTSRYAEAIPYLQRYEKSVGTLSPSDSYELGYALYKAGNYSDAITHFQNATSNEDSLSQNAYYHIGDCYIQLNNKSFARSAFGTASKMNFDKVIQENALFNYAKLCYELSFNPFNEAIDAFNQYINQYPNSPHLEEAYNYLVNVYLSTKNYQEALNSIEKIHPLNDQLKTTFQQVAYFRGVDLFNNLEMDSAIHLFNQSLMYPYTQTFTDKANYWKAEALYRTGKYDQAIDAYQNFMDLPGAFQMQEYNNSNYNIGYAYLKTKDYLNSALWFRKFLANNPSDAKKIADANMRIGDDYFVTKDFSNAANYYNEAITLKSFNVDYAMYQEAMAYGLVQENQKKTNTLLNLLSQYPKSDYTVAANFELANTYVNTNNNSEAMAYYQKILTNYPNSSYYNQALLQTGLIYFNQNQNDLAFNTFDKLIKRDRKSPEANVALGFIKKIYISKNDVDGMQKYFSETAAVIPEASLDSVTFNIAKDHYMQKDCDNAIPAFDKYISKFPAGIFSLQANFYRAQCEIKSGNIKEALVGYNFVIGNAKNDFTEQSLLNASTIYFQQKNYSGAFDDYNKLETEAENPENILTAHVGQLRCAIILKNDAAAQTAANKVISSEIATKEEINEAHLDLAKINLQNEQYDAAMNNFQYTTVNAKNVMGAEAKYNIAYIQYIQTDFKSSEKTIFDLVNQEPSYPYWMGKGLLLLSDNYEALKDTFQAKLTLKSVISNSTFPDLVTEAQTKLTKIEQAQKPVAPVSLDQQMNVEFQGNTKESDHLFQQPADTTKTKK
ncbi:MAG: tetratricopeptide repeat protein [Bacteroidia bacterium]